MVCIYTGTHRVNGVKFCRIKLLGKPNGQEFQTEFVGLLRRPILLPSLAMRWLINQIGTVTSSLQT